MQNLKQERIIFILCILFENISLIKLSSYFQIEQKITILFEMKIFNFQ